MPALRGRAPARRRDERLFGQLRPLRRRAHRIGIADRRNALAIGADAAHHRLARRMHIYTVFLGSLDDGRQRLACDPRPVRPVHGLHIKVTDGAGHPHHRLANRLGALYQETTETLPGAAVGKIGHLAHAVGLMLSIILESIGMTATVRAKRYSGAGRTIRPARRVRL